MKTLPRLPIANLPTPVENLPRLTAALAGAQLMIKRDDLTGLGFGGNKTRKLELLVADAQSKGARTLITAGAIQSNHCRQTAAAAARYGFDCILILVGKQPAHPSGNLLLDLLFGAETVFTTKAKRESVHRAVFQQAEQQGRKPYLIPYGGSSPVGAVAYALAFAEMLEQIPPPDVIVFPSSSGGTHAGLVLGAKLSGYPGKVLGISIDEPEIILRERVASLAKEAAEIIGEPASFIPDEIHVNAGYLGGGYGVMGDLERVAMRMFARIEGILLDPVYTGRAAGALIDLIQKGYFNPDDRVLFWHTGGSPALFAEQYAQKLL
jgi:D-cysteine desulfhydrase family pyridoxal phosphate-dependent enzyme